MNTNHKETIQPSAQIFRSARELMDAIAFESAVRPVVLAYENAILAKHQWRIAPEIAAEFGMPIDKVILNRDDAYLLASDVVADFYKECHEHRMAAGLPVIDPDGCPLLEAQHRRIQAEDALIKAMGTVPGLESFANGRAPSVDLRKRVIDLSLRFVAPFIGKADLGHKRFTPAN